MALEEEEKRRKDLEIELRTVTDFAQTELQSMTANLIEVRKANEISVIIVWSARGEIKGMILRRRFQSSKAKSYVCELNCPTARCGSKS